MSHTPIYGSLSLLLLALGGSSPAWAEKPGSVSNPQRSHTPPVSTPARRKASVESPNALTEKPADRPGQIQCTFFPRASMFSLQTFDRQNGTTGNVTSGVNPGLGFRWTPTWNARRQTFIEFHGHSVSIRPPSGTAFTDTGLLIWEATAGVEFYPFSFPLLISASGGLKNLFFIRALDLNGNFTFDKKALPVVRLALSQLFFYRPGSLSLGVEAGGGVLFSGSTNGYTLNDGFEYGGRIYLLQDTSWGRWRAGLGVLGHRISTSSTNPLIPLNTDQRMWEGAFEIAIGLRFK